MVVQLLLNKNTHQKTMDVSHEARNVTTKPKRYDLANILVCHGISGKIPTDMIIPTLLGFCLIQKSRIFNGHDNSLRT